MKKTTTLNLAFLSALAVGTTCAQGAVPGKKAKTAQPSKPNVIILLADDLGFGDIACNGSFQTISTPNIDRVAAEGVRFANAHATASTSTPSRYSILTGEYAWREPGTGIAPGDAAMIVTPSHRTLPAMMQRAGYTTAAVGKWHLGLGDKAGEQDWNGTVTPGLKDIGFDYSYIMAATADRVPCVYIENGRVVGLDLEAHPEDSIRVSYQHPFPGEPTGRENPELLKLKASHGHDNAIVNSIGRIGYMTGGGDALWVDENIADTITERAVQFIERSVAAQQAATEGEAQPFFLYFCTNDIHVPRAPHPRFVGRSGMGARGDAILQFDWSVGRVLEVLDSLGIADNTLLILSSDNGPVVDDGYQDRAVELLGEHRPWGTFRGGKYSIFEAGTRVPALVRWPRVVPQGKVSEAAASQVDWFASLAALVGVELSAGEAPDSRNELDVWLGQEREQGREHIVEHAGTLSITVDDWKYIAPSNGAARNNQVNIELGNSREPQLYYLVDDMGERNNLAAEYPERVAALAAQLKAVQETNDRQQPTQTILRTENHWLEAARELTHDIQAMARNKAWTGWLISDPDALQYINDTIGEASYNHLESVTVIETPRRSILHGMLSQMRLNIDTPESYQAIDLLSKQINPMTMVHSCYNMLPAHQILAYSMLHTSMTYIEPLDWSGNEVLLLLDYGQNHAVAVTFTKTGELTITGSACLISRQSIPELKETFTELCGSECSIRELTGKALKKSSI